MLTVEQVERHLEQGGWRAERVDPSTLRADFSSPNARFPFFVRVTNDWVFFTIVPYAKAPPDAPYDEVVRLRLYRRLLEINRTMTLAKFALDEEADVLLTVELAASAAPAELSGALEALCFYADAFFVEVQALLAA